MLDRLEPFLLMEKLEINVEAGEIVFRLLALDWRSLIMEHHMEATKVFLY
jgi:hypothetical protein